MTGPTTEPPRRRLYALHRWVGLLFALLGMLVFFSGAIATFHEEIDDWAGRGDRFPSPQQVESFDFDEAMAAAANGVDGRYLHQVEIALRHGRPLLFFFHEHIKDGMGVEELGVARTLDPETLEVLGERTGDRAAAFTPRFSHSLSRFFIDLHIFLLMPETLGLIATGISGFALLLLIATGFLVHRPNRTKMTRGPRTQHKRVFFSDFHTLVGSWSLPFTVIVALTGAFFSFAGVVLVPVVAMVAFDGDQEALVRTVVGSVDVSDVDATASLQPFVEDAIERTDQARLTSIGLDHWGESEASATVQLVSKSPFGDSLHTLVYDGHTGEFLLSKPRLGTQASLGNTLVMLVAQLHFGTLFGIVTKLLWGVLGIATCVLAATGLLIFVARERSPDHVGMRLVRSMTVALAGGLPFATGLAFLSWVAAGAFEVDDPMTAMTWTFLLGLALCAGVGAVLKTPLALSIAWAASGVALAATVALAPSVTRVSLADAWSDPSLRHTLFVDGALLAGAFLCVGGAMLIARSKGIGSYDPQRGNRLAVAPVERS
ncbi:MAG: PepSY-associated TM helix domain-containing protein [Myxococcota bacterium]